MFARVEKRGGTPEKQYDLLICTLREGESQYAHPSVFFPLGSDMVKITSSDRSLGTISIEGRAHIAMLRDAIVLICEKMGI